MDILKRKSVFGMSDIDIPSGRDLNITKTENFMKLEIQLYDMNKNEHLTKSEIYNLRHFRRVL